MLEALPPHWITEGDWITEGVLSNLDIIRLSMGCGASQDSGVPLKAAGGSVRETTVSQTCAHPTSTSARAAASSPDAFATPDRRAWEQMVRGGAGVSAKVSSLTASCRKRSPARGFSFLSPPLRDNRYFCGRRSFIQRAGGGPDAHASGKRSSIDQREGSRRGYMTETHRPQHEVSTRSSGVAPPRHTHRAFPTAFGCSSHVA